MWLSSPHRKLHIAVMTSVCSRDTPSTAKFRTDALNVLATVLDASTKSRVKSDVALFVCSQAPIISKGDVPLGDLANIIIPTFTLFAISTANTPAGGFWSRIFSILLEVTSTVLML
jgi:hypothetical protein